MALSMYFIYLLKYFSTMHPKITKFCDPKSINYFSSALIKINNKNKTRNYTNMMYN